VVKKRISYAEDAVDMHSMFKKEDAPHADLERRVELDTTIGLEAGNQNSVQKIRKRYIVF
jgi:hypothetical protein